MNTINNSNLHFTAQVVLDEDLGNSEFRRACRQFKNETKNDNSKMYLWKNGDTYEFGLTKKPSEPNPTTQAIGRDVFGYLFMEDDTNGIVDFLKLTLKALKERNNNKNSFIDADVDAAATYLNDEKFGNLIARKGYLDYQKIGECIHFIS